MPQLVKGSIYMSVPKGSGAGWPVRIVQVDAKTLEERTLFETQDPDMIAWMTVTEDWLVWESGGALRALSMHNQRQYVVDEKQDYYDAAINGDDLAWIDTSTKPKASVTIRNMSSKETTRVAFVSRPGLYNNKPTWNGTTLWWSDVINGTGVYRAYDSLTGTIEDIPPRGGNRGIPGHLQGAGDKIFSQNYEDASNWNWAKQKLCYLDLESLRCNSLFSDGHVGNYKVTSDFVSVLDNRSHLTLYRVARLPDTSKGYTPVQGNIDFIEKSPDGTLIAVREGDANTYSQLFVIRPRRD